MHLQQFKRLAVCIACALQLLCWVGSEHAAAQKKSGRRAQTAARTRKGAGAADEPEARTSPYVTEGLRYADEGKWAEAIKSYRHALVDNPQDVDAYLNMGDAYLNLGNDKEALAAYQQAVKLAPKSAEAYNALGAAYNIAGQNSDAFKPLVRAIQLDPDYAEAYYGIGYAYQRLENYKDAIGYLKSAIRLKPDYPEAYLALGLSYLGLGDNKLAEAQLKTLEGMDATLAQELARAIQKAPAAAARNNGQMTTQRPIQSTPTPRANTPTPQSQRTTTSVAPMQAAQQPQSVQAAQAPQSVNPVSLLAVELSFWNSIKDSNDPAEFAAYIKKYPNGQFIDLARIRLRALESKKSVVAQPEAAPTPSAPPAAETKQEQPKPTQEQPAQLVVSAPPVAQPAEPAQSAEPDGPTTLEETLDQIRRYFPSKFIYQLTTPNDAPNAPPVTRAMKIDVELLRFEGCTLEWRDGADRLSMSLADLDPQSVKVELRQKPETTFNMEVWNVSLTATAGQGAFREIKGDGSTENRYNGVDLQYGDQATASRLARALQRAIKLCGGKPAPS
ncbi:MAG: hypothetical protein DMF64_09545 [Acidobacteria bacterium]|nr:MAG: hypothetical protein DMF64_09545 [Acidobacteriota bacterium]